MRYLLTAFAAVVLAALGSVSQVAAFGLIRDTEIEATLDRIANPIFRAAGLHPATVNIYIVNSSDINAFVAGGQNIFLFTGLLTRLQTVDQLRAVISHEVGHITGGHITRRNDALGGARGIAIVGMVGAAVAAIGGSPEAGAAIAFGSSAAAQRNALAHSRAEEASADQSGLRYIAAAGGNPAAMLEVLRMLRGQDMQRTVGVDPYAQTHPLSTERMALIEDKVASLPSGRPVDAEDTYWHARMVAKLTGFLARTRSVVQKYPPDDQSEPAILARAVAYHRQPDPQKSLALVNHLIELKPDDPYYHELKGQFLLESGDAVHAVASYQKAVDLAPFEPQILGGLGRALLNTNDPALTEKAREALAGSTRYDKANTGVLRDLALAEARLGNDGAAALATAERFVIEGQFSDAQRNAQRASILLPRGSPGWQRAQDVLAMVRRTQGSSR